MDERLVMTQEERTTIECHLNLLGMTFDDIARVWRREGVLCAAYKNGKWWHYGANGEW